MANGMKGHIWPEGLSLPIPRDVGLIASKARLKPGDLTHTHDIKQEGRGENIALGQMKVWDYLSPPLSRNASKVFPACDAFKKKKKKEVSLRRTTALLAVKGRRKRRKLKRRRRRRRSTVEL